MALNYQRNSYTLWESALKTYNDEETRFVIIGCMLFINILIEDTKTLSV